MLDWLKTNRQLRAEIEEERAKAERWRKLVEFQRLNPPGLSTEQEANMAIGKVTIKAIAGLLGRIFR